MIGETIIKYIIKNDLENKYIGFKDKLGNVYWIEQITIDDNGEIIFMESEETYE